MSRLTHIISREELRYARASRTVPSEQRCRSFRQEKCHFWTFGVFSRSNKAATPSTGPRTHCMHRSCITHPGAMKFSVSGETWRFPFQVQTAAILFLDGLTGRNDVIFSDTIFSGNTDLATPDNLYSRVGNMSKSLRTKVPSPGSFAE